jgi:hypothetical protein
MGIYMIPYLDFSASFVIMLEVKFQTINILQCFSSPKKFRSRKEILFEASYVGLTCRDVNEATCQEAEASMLEAKAETETRPSRPRPIVCRLHF